MNIENRKVADLKVYARNAKKHTEKQIANVAESIRQFGWVQPIVIDGGGCIIIGHCRYEASKRLGLAEVPCVMMDELTEEQVQKLRLLDNKLNESPWDSSLLEADLFELDFSDFDVDWGLKEEKKDVKGDVEFSEVLNEEHNYIVLYFDNDIDWLQATSLLDIPNVKALLTNRNGKDSKTFRRIGQARVMKGSDAIRKIQEA